MYVNFIGVVSTVIRNLLKKQDVLRRERDSWADSQTIYHNNRSHKNILSYTNADNQLIMSNHHQLFYHGFNQHQQP